MNKEDNIIVPRWLLERIEDTLRIQYNINLDKKTGETCQDRNIKESLNGVRKLLKGEELTGGERLERLQPSLPSNIDEAAEEYAYNNWEDNDYHTGASEGLPFDAIGHTEKCFKAGAEWMAGQGYKQTERVYNFNGENISCVSPVIYLPKEFEIGDEVIVQIRKKDE